MGLFDRKEGGFMDEANAWMTPERALAFSAIGTGFSQMAANQPVNLAPHHQQLAQRQMRAEQKRTLDASGLMEQFTPDQRAMLAQMEPSAAQKIIAAKMFAPAAGPTKGINVGGRVVDPTTGRVIYQPPAEGSKPITVNGQLVNPDTGEVIGDYRDPPPPPGAPTVKTVTIEDGSEVALEWRPDPEDGENGGSWVPIDAPAGGSTPRPSGKLSEQQSKVALFGGIQSETSPVLNKVEERYNPANISDAVASNTPLAGNFLKTEEGQVYSAAGDAWLEGALRLSSGQAVTESEFKRLKGVYFAQPGDTPRTVQFKSKLRAMYERAIRAAQGSNEEPMLPSDFADIFGDDLEPKIEGLNNDDLKYLGLE